jgi:hypothetical protein
MRISEKKVNRIVKKVADLIESDNKVKCRADRITLEAEIKSVILADLQIEDQIEEEAKQILEKHARLMQIENIDYQAMLIKTKLQIARQKGFVI